MIQQIRQRWHEESGYREVLKISLPLILSTGSWSLQQFIDRMFLTWYSPAAIAASMPAGLANWTLLSLFVGIAVYVSTFVAQYYGAQRPDRIGAAVWQGIHFSLITAVAVIPFYFLAPGLFALFGHSPEVMQLETVYFQILLFGAPFVVIGNAISGFFSGLGKTWTVMWVNFAGTAVNLVLDYLMIFGYGGFPELGMAGAGWATVIGIVFSAALFFALMLRPPYRQTYQTLRQWRPKPELFRRLLRYGGPNGMHFLLEIFAFTIFIFLVGQLGLLELAASNIAFNINSLTFMPMFGLTIGVSVLVGQRLGEGRPALAEKATWSAFHLGFIFFTTIGFGYFAAPWLFIYPFAAQADPVSFAPIGDLATILLRFVALYSLVDAGNMIFSGALKGAGDTRFVALCSFTLSWVTMLIPSMLALYVFGWGIYALWTGVTVYVASLCLAFWLRFRQGKWKSLRVIENEGAIPPVQESGRSPLIQPISPATDADRP